ncbi:MAG: S8 family peptidase [Romboutsia sp.]|nr:S8 family peptidase [Romboutsia sp.]
MERSYIVIYNTSVQDFESELQQNLINRYIILNNLMAVIYVENNFDEQKLSNLKTISWWEISNPMSSLINITNNSTQGESVRSAAGTDYIYNNPYITPTGENVLIAIIDSGINYLHPDFINPDQTTKIVSIWDQESTAKEAPQGYLFGSEFTREEINEAIRQNNPTLSIDEIGTGTIAAGIAAGLGNSNNGYDGVARGSELVIVKLRSYTGYYKEGKVNYQVSDFLAGIRYVTELANRLNRKIVINITVGERSRTVIEASLLDTFNYLNRSGYIVVSGAGNEGNSDIHYKGNIQITDKYQDIIIQVGEQTNLDIILCPSGPDKIGASIISPSGEMSYIINYAPDNFSYSGRFNLEDTDYELNYIYPWLQSGNLQLIARLKDVKPGIWTLRLYPEFIIKGEYDVYLPNKNLISDETRFINPTSESTITFFATTRNVITVGAYNGKTNGIWIGSSNGSLRTSPIKPDIVAPGVDIIAPNNNNSYTTATGTGVSSSMVAGVLAVIIDYISTQEQDSRIVLYTQVLKTYLMLGATKKEIYTYPNTSEGYGNLNLEETLRQIANNI